MQIDIVDTVRNGKLEKIDIEARGLRDARDKRADKNEYPNAQLVITPIQGTPTPTVVHIWIPDDNVYDREGIALIRKFLETVDTQLERFRVTFLEQNK